MLCGSLLHFEVLQAADLHFCPRYCFLVFHVAKLLQRLVRNFLDQVIRVIRYDAIVAGGHRTLEDAGTDEVGDGWIVTDTTP